MAYQNQSSTTAKQELEPRSLAESLQHKHPELNIEGEEMLLYFFAMVLVLMAWYNGTSEGDVANLKLAAQSIYDPRVMTYSNVIYVLAKQMGISTHVLAGFLQLHLEEITTIVQSGELIKLAESVQKYHLTNPESNYPEAEALTYYVWERMGAAFGELNSDKWQALWEKIYSFFQTVEQVEEILPEILAYEAESRAQHTRDAAQVAARQAALSAHSAKPAWQSWL